MNKTALAMYTLHRAAEQNMTETLYSKDAGLEAYQTKMEAAGIDNIREELQRQLDKYLAELK